MEKLALLTLKISSLEEPGEKVSSWMGVPAFRGTHGLRPEGKRRRGIRRRRGESVFMIATVVVVVVVRAVVGSRGSALNISSLLWFIYMALNYIGSCSNMRWLTFLQSSSWLGL